MSERIARQYYEKYWQAGLSDWSPVGITITPYEQKLLARFVPPAAKVLDFGCGDGAHAAQFVLSRRCCYTGVDVSQHAVALCRAKGLEAVPYAAGESLPFGAESFDNVLSFEVLEHLFDPEAALQEINRVLRPRGYLIGSVPNSVWLANRLLMASGHFSPGGSPATSLKAPWKDPHIRFFSKSSLSSLLMQVGFRECRILGSDFSLLDFPVLYKSGGFFKRAIGVGGWPFARLGKWWPSLFSPRLYFVALK
jgi:2-polyprenyl-6-hydroxyphenyl methylase/3-demethylubiquinone-9 3-methyltransferase